MIKRYLNNLLQKAFSNHCDHLQLRQLILLLTAPLFSVFLSIILFLECGQRVFGHVLYICSFGVSLNQCFCIFIHSSVIRYGGLLWVYRISWWIYTYDMVGKCWILICVFQGYCVWWLTVCNGYFTYFEGYKYIKFKQKFDQFECVYEY